jgi:hypothetical protein
LINRGKAGSLPVSPQGHAAAPDAAMTTNK